MVNELPAPSSRHETVLVIDFGSQYTQLIARRIREAHIYCQIVTPAFSLSKIKALRPKALVLSGGPASVYDEGAPSIDPGIFALGVPILGICYGLQLACRVLGGQVERGRTQEYGHADLNVLARDDLFHRIGEATTPVWMSHGDRITVLPAGWSVLAETSAAPFAAVRSADGLFYGVQFHPEVSHTRHGREILTNFFFKVAGLAGDWQMKSLIEELVAAIRAQVGDGKVICGLSGGVDSSVTAALIHRAVGEQLECIFVDNGLLRAGEADQVVETFERHFHMKLHAVDAAERFLSALTGVHDPEQKRKIIGRIFIDVFEEQARQIDNARFLAQGTLYPDVIESVAAHGGSTATIKSHHNVGGLPEDMNLALIEPLRWLFKDEARRLGEALALPESMVWRHPFPGPGLAVRIVGEVTAERVRTLREADAIVQEEIRAAGLYREVWQAFPVFLPVRSVGVMGDERTYENVVALRVVSSDDGMTADWVRLPYDVLARISNRIINEVRGLNRVLYDISSKPPSTIEWE